MSTLTGYIKVYRKILDWGWYRDSIVKSVFLHLLLTANFRSTEWNGRIIESGQTVISTQRLADILGLSRQQIRTALKKLKSTKEITIETTNKYSVITIVKWESYQVLTDIATDELANELTNNQPTTNQQLTNNQPHLKNNKNNKNDKNYKNNKNNMCKAEALALFEKLWKLYPNKKGKGQVSETQKKRLLTIGETALVKAIERYKTVLLQDGDWRRPQNGSTFFNSGYIDYLDENFEQYTQNSLNAKEMTKVEEYESEWDRRVRESKERGETLPDDEYFDF